MTQQDCFNVEFPLSSRLAGMRPSQREQLMAAKLQCYHTWLFYYLYSADYKFIKAIFKLKFAFTKVLFAQDFSVIFHNKNHQSEGVTARKKNALKMLKKLYFPHEDRDYKQSYQNNQYRSQENNSRPSKEQREKRHSRYFREFKRYMN